MANDYATAWDALGDAIGAAAGKASGSVNEISHMSVDQQLKVAEIAALLSISQELSAFNPQNTTYYDDLGKQRNGWGQPTGK